MVGIVLLGTMLWGYIRWQRPGDQLAAQVVNFYRVKEKVVALTFDDGPHPVMTALLLDTLRRYHAHATFFVVGTKAEEAPELIHREEEAGNQVASHTYSHDNLDKLSPGEIEKEILYADGALARITREHPRYVRPPGGEYDLRSISVFARLHRTFALWSVNPGDWEKPPPQKIVDLVLKQVRPGTVVLMHDDALNTVEALPRILSELKRRGYRFVTMSELEMMSGMG
jgi:peptidoglycan/xylan/chitin deacetylase (PgdA/CDA1 family)